jgi:serine/threonine protein kinase/Flp pilus assembly protein TadD
MGTVYEAWQRSLDRIVALKVLDAQVGRSRTAVTRFQREAQAAAKLQHTHIIPIFAQGEQDGVYYYAMEFVEGEALNTIIARQRREFHVTGGASPDLDDTVEIPRVSAEVDLSADTVAMEPPPGTSGVADSGVVLPEPSRSTPRGTRRAFNEVARDIAAVAAALDYAHARGVIHRDIKPHNLMMGPDGRLRIADFGLARVDTQPGVTVTGEFLGSPLYMSAEQITKGPAAVDHRTDLYSLGATLYEWVTLSPPFSGETREQVIARILSAEPVPPRRIDPSIPMDLETICLKAIEKDPAKRYQSGREMHDDLGRFLTGQSILATRAGRMMRSFQLVRRRPLESIAAAALLLLLIPTLLLIRSNRELERKSEAVVKAEQQTQVAQRQAEDLLDVVLALTPETQLAGATVEALLPVVQGLMKAGSGGGGGQAVGPKPAEVGSPEGIARRAVEELYWSSPASGALEAELAARSFGGGQDQRGAGEVGFFRDIEEDDDAQSRYGKISFMVSANPTSMHARRLHAAVCSQLRQYDEMLEDGQVLVRNRANDPVSYLWRGIALLLGGDRAGAAADFGKAVELEPSAPWGRTLRALALLGLERPDDALLDLEAALSIESPPIVARLVRGAVHAARHDWEAAIADVSYLIELDDADADALALRGEFRGALGDYTGASEDFKLAMDIAGKSPTIVTQYVAMVLAARERARGGDAPRAEEADATSEAPAPKTEDHGQEGSAWQWLDRFFGPPTREDHGAPRRHAAAFPPRIR